MKLRPDDDDAMRVWTIQPITVWEQLREKRLLYADEDCGGAGGYVPPAYQWLQEQLKRRLQGYSGHLPWWAYCRKPDLRLHRHMQPESQRDARLELECLPASVLRFPCWAWHTVFCQDYLAAGRGEYEDWWKKVREFVPDEDIWPLPEPWHAQLEATWHRLFDSGLPRLSWDMASKWSREECLEAVFEALRLDEVREVTIFRGASKSMPRGRSAKR